MQALNTFRLVCFDPGLTTGVAIFEYGELKAYKEAMSLAEVIDVLKREKELNFTPHIIYEGFARGNSVVDEQIKTIEMCGAIKAACTIYGFTYSSQYPAVRKGFVPVAKKMFQVLFPSRTQKQYHHSIDAAAHGIAYMKSKDIDWHSQFWYSNTFGSSSIK